MSGFLFFVHQCTQTHTFLHFTHPQLYRYEVCVLVWQEQGRRSCSPLGWWGHSICAEGWSLSLPQPWQDPGPKLKTDVFGVHYLSYYCSIVIYKSVWDMEISHATQDMGWVKAHCETGPSALWEGLICKLMLSLHFARTVYSVFSSLWHVIIL